MSVRTVKAGPFDVETVVVPVSDGEMTHGLMPRARTVVVPIHIRYK